MAYTISYSGGVFTVADGTLNQQNTTLAIPGRNYSGYGSPVDQNQVTLLENSASAPNVSGPANPIMGQLWFTNTASSRDDFTSLKVNFSNVPGTADWQPIAINNPNANATFGNVITTVLTTGDPNISGILIGNWAVAANSQFKVAAGGEANFIGSQVLTNSLTTTGPTVAGNIVGQWYVDPLSSFTLGNSAYIDATRGNLISYILTTGNPAQSGNLTGNWTLTPASNLLLSGSQFSIVPGSNSIVDVRTGAGDFFYANTINAGSSTANAALTGNWTVGSGSNLNLASNAIANFLSGTLYSNTLYSAQPANPNAIANIDGTWQTTANSFINTTSGAGIGANNIFAGVDGFGRPVQDPTANGTIWGNWTINNDLTVRGNVFNSKIIALTGNSSNGSFDGNWTFNNALTVAGTNTLTVRNITTGATGTGGTVTGTWTLASGSRWQATYSDLGERYAADAVYPPGTVVELGGDQEVTAVKEELSDRVFGVVSTDPAYVMNAMAGDDKTHPVIALAGRVPVNVTGIVKKFDRLVSAGNGRARAAKPEEITATNVIGRALEEHPTATVGQVMTVVVAKV